jgi:two-component system, chemotaxis family, sensor kinase Cph1
MIIAASAAPDLGTCDQEPIRTPGAIQPHGVMLILDLDGLNVLRVAGDVEERLGIDRWQNRTLSALIGDALNAKVAAFLEAGAVGGFVGQLRTVTGEVLDLTAHRSPPYMIVELEAASKENLPASLVLGRIAAAASRLEQTTSLITLTERAASEFRALTGFDRVMIYRFLDENAGQVLAEDRRVGLPSFLNHHFPASDIPSQARALYLRNLVRVIPDVSYRPVALRPVWTDPVPLDMSDCSLRSVSPIHLSYLRNMGVQASASFSIVTDGKLWGLVACHNETPRFLTHDVRAACLLLVGSLSRQIKAKEESESYRQRIRLRSFEDGIVTVLAREGSPEETMSRHLPEIGRMMGGDGLALLRGSALVIDGICPAESEVRGFAHWLLTRSGGPIFSTDNLEALYPPAVDFRGSGSGVLSITLSAEEPWLLMWFRAEKVETIKWAGDPHQLAKSDPSEPLTPRASFEEWAEIVRGRARRWSLAEAEAATRLRTALLDVKQNQRVHALNRQLTKTLQDKDFILQQKEFLLSEVNHRVQNSLQIVSSFLAMQAKSSDNPELHAALEEARRRMSAVALVHRRLYGGDRVDVVNAAHYVEELCADTFSFMGQDWAQHLALNLAPVLVSTDRAVTLGLVLTELMINSNKYAYGGAAGPIEIELNEQRGELYMIVSDRGRGKEGSRSGFGSRIVESLIKQMGGRLTCGDNHPGVRTEVVVPVETEKRPV